MEQKAEIGIFGGTGIYDSSLLEDAKEITLDTPYGKTSDPITVGTFQGRNIAFLPRHGKKHSIPPHMINFRANIWAFKELGVKRIIAPSAVGSLKEEIKPSHFALPSQFLDFTKSEQNVTIHKDCTYVCIEGPRFSTKAESKFFRSAGADIIGMTLVPECQLAREAQMCYVSISTVTDYDVWAEKSVTAKEVIETLSKNVEKIKKMLIKLIDEIPQQRGCSCDKALAEAEY